MAVNKKASGSLDQGSVPLRNPVHEKFCILVQSGIRPSAAAVQCGLGKSSGSYLFGRPDVCARIEWLKKDAVRLVRETVAARHTKVSERGGIRRRRIVDITRNEIIMILADIARNDEVIAGTRVSAALGLADIFLLRPKKFSDLDKLIGWTDDEIDAFNVDGAVPFRVTAATGARSAADLGGPASFRTDKNKGS